MINSMTGFGRSEGICCGIPFRVEVRSVNHRYCDINVKIPDGLGRLEQKVKNVVSTRFSRGKFEISISVVDTFQKGARSLIDLSNLAQYKAMLKELSSALNVSFNIRGDIGLSDILALKGLFASTGVDYDNLEIDKSLMKILDMSLDELMRMRLKEGKVIFRDLMRRLSRLVSMKKRIERHLPLVIRDMKKKYIERIKELSDIPQLNMERVYQEIAISLERMDITEEIVRLDSHIAQLKDKLVSGGVVGRSLDFLLQELNREINTIASKASDSRISQVAVDMKAEVERIREQVQNVE